MDEDCQQKNPFNYYSLVANRPGVGMVGGLENFLNINMQGLWKIFQIVIAVGGRGGGCEWGGGGFQNFKHLV